jgi:hypothetical protein
MFQNHKDLERAVTDAAVMRADSYGRALAFMNEKGVLEEFVDREIAAAHAPTTVRDKDIIQPEGD